MDRGGIGAAGDHAEPRCCQCRAARRPGLTESGSATRFPLVSAEVVVLHGLLGDCNMGQQAESEHDADLSLAWACRKLASSAVQHAISSASRNKLSLAAQHRGLLAARLQTQ
jgi:hypothetical protein